MKNLPCYVMAFSSFLAACSSSSTDSGAAGGAASIGSGGSTSAVGSGGATSAGGSTSTTVAGATSNVAADSSGLDGTRIVVELGATDAATLCRWLEAVLGLVPGASATSAYASGTWFVDQCTSGFPVYLWGSPRQCEAGVSSGNSIGCPSLTVASFESCIKAAKNDLCVLERATECATFNSCYPQIVED